MPKIIGSQRRETLKESGYTLVSRPRRGEAILEDEGGKRELWAANNNFAGFVVEIGRWGYEFVRSLPSTR